MIRMILGTLVNLIEEGEMKSVLSVCGARNLPLILYIYIYIYI